MIGQILNHRYRVSVLFYYGRFYELICFVSVIACLNSFSFNTLEKG